MIYKSASDMLLAMKNVKFTYFTKLDDPIKLIIGFIDDNNNLYQISLMDIKKSIGDYKELLKFIEESNSYYKAKTANLQSFK